jgi:hypothetical protein
MHLRVLRVIADRLRRELAEHDAVDHMGDPAAPRRRLYLERMVRRTTARVADAEARRRSRHGYGAS